MVISKTSKAAKTSEISKVSARERYFYATGGRKTAQALVRLRMKRGSFTVNGKEYAQYFRLPNHQSTAVSPLILTKLFDEASAEIKVKGGGLHAQAEAVRNAIAKALVKFKQDLKKSLRREGFITRDSRMVERKKYGLKKARRAPQWAKR